MFPRSFPNSNRLFHHAVPTQKAPFSNFLIAMIIMEKQERRGGGMERKLEMKRKIMEMEMQLTRKGDTI